MPRERDGVLMIWPEKGGDDKQEWSFKGNTEGSGKESQIPTGSDMRVETILERCNSGYLLHQRDLTKKTTLSKS